MKNIIAIFFVAACLLMSFTMIGDKKANSYAAPGAYNIFTPTISPITITNAGVDTTLVPNQLFSKWTGSIQASAVATSGTLSAKVYVFETNIRGAAKATPRAWILRDSISLSAANPTGRVLVETYGVAHMFRTKGTGTQVATVNIYPVYKTY